MSLDALPCPSFPWSFRKDQGKPQKHQGFFSAFEPLKTLENKQNTLKKTKEFRSKKNTKETKTPRKRRTGYLRHLLSYLQPSDSKFDARPSKRNQAWLVRDPVPEQEVLSEVGVFSLTFHGKAPRPQTERPSFSWNHRLQKKGKKPLTSLKTTFFVNSGRLSGEIKETPRIQKSTPLPRIGSQIGHVLVCSTQASRYTMARELRKGAPCLGLQTSGEITMQNASCQTGCHKVRQKNMRSLKEMSSHEVAGRWISIPVLQRTMCKTHGFLYPSSVLEWFTKLLHKSWHQHFWQVIPLTGLSVLWLFCKHCGNFKI